MVERKLLKTKLCSQFQRGCCARRSLSCPFAHGESELRRFSASFHGNRDFGNDDLRDKHFRNGDLRDKHFRNGDLRDKLDRKHNQQKVYSPVRDERNRNTYREHGRSRSPEKESDRKHRKKQRLDYQSDISGSLKISDDVGIEAKDGNFSTQSRDVLVEKLKQVELDVDRFDQRKCELLDKLESGAQEVESLTSKIQELEAQFCKEKEENQRILSKIGKFVKTYKHHTRIQDQLKKSEAGLHKLGDNLGSDIKKISGNEEGSKVNVVSDEEASGSPLISYNEASGSRVAREPKQAKVNVKAPVMLKKDSRGNIRTQLSYHNQIETKSTVSKLGSPLINISTHSDEEEEEVEIELEDNNLRPIETRVENVTPFDSKETKGSSPLTLPPPPPISKANYSEYEGDDECIDVDGFDDEMVQLDDI